MVTLARQWVWLSVSSSCGVGTAMLVTRDRGSVVDPDTTADANAARPAACADAVIDFERMHGQTLFGFVRRLGVSDSSASDVVQESMLRLFDALSGEQPIRDVKSWTYHVAYRLAMDEHRHSARALRLVQKAGHPTVEIDQANALELRQVWAEVDRLPERQRAVLYLRFRADLAFEDVGATLAITASAARSHCTQALAALRHRLTKASL